MVMFYTLKENGKKNVLFFSVRYQMVEDIMKTLSSEKCFIVDPKDFLKVTDEFGVGDLSLINLQETGLAAIKQDQDIFYCC